MAITALLSATTAHAQQFEMDFTIIYDSYTIGFDPGPDPEIFSTKLVVTGKCVWDVDESDQFFTSGNVRRWEFLSFNAVAFGTLEDGTAVSFEIDSDSSETNPLNFLQHTEVSGNTTWLFWIANDLEMLNSEWEFGNFSIRSLDGNSMPTNTSPLPSTPEGYSGPSGFQSTLNLITENFEDYFFIPSSVFTVVREVDENPCRADFNGDGSLDFFDVSAFLNELSAGCP